MTYRKVYVGLPMDDSIVTAMGVLKELGMAEGEFRVHYSLGLTTIYVVAAKAATALDGLLEASLLNQDDAWTYFISSPVEYC